MGGSLSEWGWCAGGGHLAGEWLLHVIENSPGLATSAGVPVKDAFVVNRESRECSGPTRRRCRFHISR